MCLHNGRPYSLAYALMSDAHCHFQEKQQSDYEGLTGDLKTEQSIYAHLAKTLQDSDR